MAVMRQYYRLPEAFRRAVIVRRRSKLWLNAGILFIHVPKVAGTSINFALYGRFMGHVRATDIERWASPQLKALPSFAVTRNPWDRLVSAYRFAKRGRGVGGAYQAGVFRPEQYRIPEFENFERFVTEWLAERDLEKLDRIFQPQTLFVCDGSGKLLVDHVGPLEDMSSTRRFLLRHMGRVPPIEHSNSSGRTVDYREFYSPRLVRIVGRLYADDVNSFGYSF